VIVGVFEKLPSYIIDGKGIIRHTSVNDLEVGRSTGEYLNWSKHLYILISTMMFVKLTGNLAKSNKPFPLTQA
jgi:hypothetical protein